MVLGVIALLAAILTPIVSGYLEDARVRTARQDLSTLAEGLLAAQKDLGDFPVFKDASQPAFSDDSTYAVLTGPGPVPALNSSWSTAYDAGADAGALTGQLIRNDPGYATSGRFRWRGPYVEEIPADPWGKAYLVNSENLFPASPNAGYVLSAGPDGRVDTPYDLSRTSGNVVPSGDDVLVRVR